MISNKNKFETYLEEKYNQDFTIKKISYDILHGRTYHAYAVSENNPKVTFHVGQNLTSAGIDDAYHYEMWKYQAETEITPLIEETFPDKVNHAVEISDFLNPGITNSSNVPNYQEMVILEIGIAMDLTEINEENEETELRKALTLLKALNEKHLHISHFGISYKNKALQLNTIGLKSVNTYLDLKKRLIDYK
ncbi:hypothetical protein [Mesobacillus thioparans]|uniref:hypothetical protein n=1 Tax=Mesobacillus thioparans TaxID=370439 RepID=UPI0039EF03BC